MTYAELKAHIDVLTPEQLAMTVYASGEDIGAVCYGFEILDEDHIDPSGDGMEPVSSYDAADIEGERVVARRGQPLLCIDQSRRADVVCPADKVRG